MHTTMNFSFDFIIHSTADEKFQKDNSNDSNPCEDNCLYRVNPKR